MEKRYKIGIYLNTLFSLLGIIACLMCIFTGSNRIVLVATSNLILFALVIYYTTVGYKIPHGNLLKILMLLFALRFLLTLNSAIKHDLKPTIIMAPLTMAAITYVAGRLNKIHQNKYLMCVILLMICHICFYPLDVSGLTFESVFGTLSKLFLWLDLCSAYFLRFKLHKEAGLMDRVKELKQ